MTTEAQPQTQQEQPDDSNAWRILGRLEANQHAILQRMDRQDLRMDRQDLRMDRMEAKMDSLDERVGNMEVQIARLETSQNALLQRMGTLEARMDKLEAKMDRLFYLMIGVGGGVIATLVAVVAT